MRALAVLLFLLAQVAPVLAANGPKNLRKGSLTQATAAKFRAPGSMSFDQQLVEGQIYRPDLSVVTGDRMEDSDGLLRLRQDFGDHAADEAGEVIK